MHFVFVELSDVVSINVLNSSNRKVVKTIHLLGRDINLILTNHSSIFIKMGV